MDPKMAMTMTTMVVVQLYPGVSCTRGLKTCRRIIRRMLACIPKHSVLLYIGILTTSLLHFPTRIPMKL